MSRRAALVGFLAAAAMLGGCGLGPGDERSGGGATEHITRDFGQRPLATDHIAKVREDQTVMRFLRSHRKVGTRYGGGFVQSIDGLSGKGSGGRRDWFFFVNGLESDVGAAEYGLNPGDVVQWDYRDWTATMTVPAIVGSYPEPFLHGRKGKRFPVRVECADASGDPCKRVKDKLAAEGVKVTGASLGAPGTQNVARVIVAPWRQARQVAALEPIERGPKHSGVFARFTGEGRALELLDAHGAVARRAPTGSGLIAAASPNEKEVAWAVTGVDEKGVEAAADALDARTLRDAFAVAVTPSGPVKLPVGAAR